MSSKSIYMNPYLGKQHRALIDAILTRKCTPSFDDASCIDMQKYDASSELGTRELRGRILTLKWCNVNLSGTMRERSLLSQQAED
jgi:hypothetical protein